MMPLKMAYLYKHKERGSPTVLHFMKSHVRDLNFEKSHTVILLNFAVCFDYFLSTRVTFTSKMRV